MADPLSADRRAIVAALQRMTALGLSHGRSGNISVRVEGGLLISPTGIPNAGVRADQLVFLQLDGKAPQGQLKPSSEWPMHAAIYRAREDAAAVVHCHSPFATAYSATRKHIPAWHYMVAAAGGDTIPCADYATFGSAELSANVVVALSDRDACLLANHGQVAVAKHLDAALDLAMEVEQLAAGYSRCLAMGEVRLLNEAEMAAVLEKFSSYGQQIDQPD